MITKVYKIHSMLMSFPDDTRETMKVYAGKKELLVLAASLDDALARVRFEVPGVMITGIEYMGDVAFDATCPRSHQ
jgi:hypothetical protein